MEGKEIILVDKLRREFMVGGERVKALRGVSFSIAEGEFVTIMGTSGSGKSTLLNILGCLDTPTSGEYMLDGVLVQSMSKNQRAITRNRKIGFVFQDFYLMDSLTVEENIMLPMILDKAEEESCYESARGYAEHFRINALMRKYPYELSGGERQRVAICRALVNRPDLILADEPTGNLDSQSGKIVIDALDQIHKEHKKTIIMVTHDPQVASYCSRIILLKDGLILDELKNGGNREEFYQEILGRMVDL